LDLGSLPKISVYQFKILGGACSDKQYTHYHNNQRPFQGLSIFINFFENQDYTGAAKQIPIPQSTQGLFIFSRLFTDRKSAAIFF
jgi:hypothetical protein